MCPGEEIVAAYVAGALARDERDSFDSHLDQCSACHELLATLGKVRVRDEPTSLGHDTVETPASWRPGDQLGRYVLFAKLGQGGMGIVYAAYDPELDRKVALKLVTHAGARARENLREEARAIAKLAHPNVVAVHDVGEVGGDVFVAMEHVEGVTLADWLHADRSPSAILDAIVQAGRGLAAAHAVGLVHRDVKPSNIMFGKDGRARVLDFGLARARADGIVGTPAYMAPEQQRGEAVDARADQYALCVVAWEALAGARPAPDARPPLANVSERVSRALARGLSAAPGDRFTSIDALLDELAPPRRVSRWLFATLGVAAIATVVVIALASGGGAEPPSCALAGALPSWTDDTRANIRSSFVQTRLPYAATAASELISELDAWAARFTSSATENCTATMIDRVQPAELHGVRTACFDRLAERLRGLLTVTASADQTVVANAAALVTSLPAPERCNDVAMLSAIEPPPEQHRVEVASLRDRLSNASAQLVAGQLDKARPAIESVATRAGVIGYEPLHAHSRYLVARLESANGRMEQAVTALHAAARAATAARDLPLLAEIWIELVQTLGNDVATLREADVFDGYAEALVAKLPDRDTLGLQLAFARCNRNVSHTRADDASRLADACRSVITRAQETRPPRHAVANAARARLGHFQRLLGQAEAARVTLREAVDEAVRVLGPQHPDTAVARNALGIAEISDKRFDAGLEQLREALAIRRAVYPGNNLYIAESLVSIGDALGASGKPKDSIPVLEEALAMLGELDQPGHLLAVNANILLGMTFVELDKADDASKRFLEAAAITERIPDREKLAVVALTLAADIAEAQKRPKQALEHLERALHLHERGKGAAEERKVLAGRIAKLRR